MRSGLCFLHRTTLIATVKKYCDCLVPHCYLFDGGFLSSSTHLFASLCRRPDLRLVLLCLHIRNSTLHGWDLPFLKNCLLLWHPLQKLNSWCSIYFFTWVSKPFSLENLYLFQNNSAQFILSGQNLSWLGKGKVMEYNLFHSLIKSKWREQALLS